MTTTTLRPNATITAADSLTGAASAHAATSDDSDASYFSDNDIAKVGLGSVTLAAGEITKSLRVRARLAANGAPILVSVTPALSPDKYVDLSIIDLASIDTYTSAYSSITLTQSNIDDLAVQVDSSSAGASNNFHELYVDLVTVPKPVTVLTAVSPDPYTASTVVPLAWSNTLDSDGDAQRRYEIIVTDDDDGDAVVFDSGSVISQSTAAGVGPLTNGNYTAKVRVGQRVNGATHWSAYSTDSFTVTVPTSDVSSVEGIADNANGSIVVGVSRDGTSEAWELIEVERSFDAGLSWSPVRTATLVDVTGNAGEFSVTDYEVPNGQAVVYRARATYYSVGLPITGAWTESASTSWSSSTVAHWMKAPLAPSLNTTFDLVEWGSASRTTSAGSFRVLGRADPVTVSDVLTNANGSFTLRITGSAEARAIDALLDQGTIIVNLMPDSLAGPNRDGFVYLTVLDVSETFVTQYYLDAADEETHLVTVTYTSAARPPDGTAGTL